MCHRLLLLILSNVKQGKVSCITPISMSVTLSHNAASQISIEGSPVPKIARYIWFAESVFSLHNDLRGSASVKYFKGAGCCRARLL